MKTFCKRLKGTSVCLISLIIILCGSAQGKDQKIGYVDLNYVIDNYRAAVDAKRAYEAEIAKYRQRADSLKQIYERAQKELEDQRLILSEGGLNAKTLEIQQLKKQYEDYLNEVWGKSGRAEIKNRELIAPILQNIRNAVKKIANRDGFMLILDASESKIVYAQADLDITSKVLDELNKEYAPVSPPTTLQTPVAIFPIFEENTEAQEENIGNRMRTAIYELLKNVSKIRTISAGEVDNAIISRNISLTSRITESDVYAIARQLQVDYVITGIVSKSGKRVNFTIILSDPRAEKILAQESGEAARVEEIKQALANLWSRFSRYFK
ncbi:MAG: OmpH family outer membrane protein [candidate division WOR-3 bacterium]|nr:OmpH family outer membrane protein [candidate division WOR-3 bacterium]